MARTILFIMDTTLTAILGVLMRWVHVSSAVLILGGFAYARFVALPALKKLPMADQHQLSVELEARFRTILLLAINGVALSGLYNLLTRPTYSREYFLWFGLKLMLALHVIGVAILMARARGADAEFEAKRPRQMTFLVISGVLVLLISAYLRRML